MSGTSSKVFVQIHSKSNMFIQLQRGGCHRIRRCLHGSCQQMYLWYEPLGTGTQGIKSVCIVSDKLSCTVLQRYISVSHKLHGYISNCAISKMQGGALMTLKWGCLDGANCAPGRYSHLMAWKNTKDYQIKSPCKANQNLQSSRDLPCIYGEQTWGMISIQWFQEAGKTHSKSQPCNQRRTRFAWAQTCQNDNDSSIGSIRKRKRQ